MALPRARQVVAPAGRHLVQASALWNGDGPAEAASDASGALHAKLEAAEASLRSVREELAAARGEAVPAAPLRALAFAGRAEGASPSMRRRATL